MPMAIMIVRPTLRCGSTISPPLFVIVVKPLKARIEKATEATMPSHPNPVVGSAKAPPENPLTQSAAMAKIAIPPILIADMTIETMLTERLPEAFTR